MINELERLLSNAYSPYDNVFYSAIVVMKDKMTFGGVSIKNNIYRDGLSAESVAIAKAVSSGYKYGDFEEILIMVSSKNINDFKYITADIITEFFEPDKKVILYDINRNQRVLKVGNLINNIY